MKALKQTTLKERLISRWCREEFPGGTPRFEPKLAAKDVGVFVLLPTLAALTLRTMSGTAVSGKNKKSPTAGDSGSNVTTPQIISFVDARAGGTSSRISAGQRTAGTLVKVRLLNTVETLADAPVHARILDDGLGSTFRGGTLIGQAVSDPNSGRINIEFRLAKYPNSDSLAAPMTARALALNGTLGIEAAKKEGFFARTTLRAASGGKADIDDSGDFKTLVARAVANGLMQEFSEEMGTKSAKAQVYVLTPGCEFFVELTDKFPSAR